MHPLIPAILINNIYYQQDDNNSLAHKTYFKDISYYNDLCEYFLNTKYFYECF